MRTAVILLLLSGCAQTVTCAPRISHHSITIKDVERDAAWYIIRPDADPATIAVIRERLNTARTTAELGALRAYIRSR